MKHAIYILNELKEVSPFLATLEKSNIFYVPENYFINLDKKVLDKIYAGETFHLNTFENNALKVPEGYFENLADNILNKIKHIEAKESSEKPAQLSLALNSVKNKNIFEIPEGYFETLPETILNKAKSQQPAKLVVMRKRSHIWQYAAAAMMTGVIALSSVWTSDKVSQQQPTLAMKTSATAYVPSYIQDSYQYKNEEQIDNGIANLSNDDIIKYLEKTGDDMDNKDLISNVSEKDLPEQDDYLLNEKTLDSYLDQLNSKESQN